MGDSEKLLIWPRWATLAAEPWNTSPPSVAVLRYSVAGTSAICIVTECRVLGDALTYMLRLRVGLRNVAVVREIPEPGEARLTLRPTVVVIDLPAGSAAQLRARGETAWPGAAIVILGPHHSGRSTTDRDSSETRSIPRDATWDELLASELTS